MHEVESRRDGPIRPLDWLKVIPFQALATSDRLGWVGLQAARYRVSTAWEYSAPPLTHHRLVLVMRPPQELDLRFDGAKRQVPPPAGAIIVVPAGTPGRVRWSGGFDWLHTYLEPALVARVAVEVFDKDPARLTVPPLDNLELPPLRAAMTAVGAELASGGPGGPLAAESMANLLTVHLLRHLSSPGRSEPGRDGANTSPSRRYTSHADANAFADSGDGTSNRGGGRGPRRPRSTGRSSPSTARRRTRRRGRR